MHSYACQIHAAIRERKRSDITRTSICAGRVSPKPRTLDLFGNTLRLDDREARGDNERPERGGVYDLFGSLRTCLWEVLILPIPLSPVGPV